MIKALTLSALVLLAPAAAQAEPVCTNMASLAETVREARQRGVAFGDALAVAENKPSAVGEVMKSMVIEAWEKPAFSTSDYQEEAVAEFRDRWHVACVKAGD